MQSKSSLAITLSKLTAFSNPKLREEQYITESEIAAEALWFAMLQGDIEGKTVADFGAGTGILGIGACLLGAKKVYVVEKDKEAVKVLKENIRSSGCKGCQVVSAAIANFNKKVRVVIQNPPFGTKQKHADRAFLEKAMETAHVVYSFHKSESKEFVMKFAAEKKFIATHEISFQFRLGATMKEHRKKAHPVAVSFWRLQRR